MKIQVANVEALKLGINSGELLVQEEGLLLLDGDLSTAVAIFGLTSVIGGCVLETQRWGFSGENDKKLAFCR